MDACMSEDFFTLPVVLDSAEFQSLNLVNCNSWQLKVSKDQSVPVVILENGDLTLPQDCPLLLPGSLPNDCVFEESLRTALENPNFNDGMLVDHVNSSISQIEECAPVEENNDSQICLDDFVETVVMYKCKLCSFKADDSKSLSSHLKSSHLKDVKKNQYTNSNDEPGKQELLEKKAYMCGKCSQAFGSFSDWRTHMSLVHKIALDVQSVLQNATLNGGSPVDLEKKKENPVPSTEVKKKTFIFPAKEKNIACTVRSCLVRLSSKDALEKHKDCHAGPRHFACPHCSEPFRKWSECANHIWSIHSEDIDLYSCPICEYKNALRVKLEIHSKIHSDTRQFMCNECGKTFKQAVQLKNHCVIHLKARGSPNIPNWSKKQVCPQCKKTFYDGKSLKKHIQSVHSNLRPYVCQVCGHTSANKNRMSLHLRQHTGEKPFSCPLCTFTTGDQNCLRRHAWRHSRVRPYSCPHCTYSCIQSYSLKKHILTQHPGLSGVFPCEQCSFSSLSQSTLDSHIAKAHDEKNDPKSSNVIGINGIDCVEGSSTHGCGKDNTVEVLLDDESQNCYEVPIIDTGGITIPADQ